MHYSATCNKNLQIVTEVHEIFDNKTHVTIWL